MTELENLRAAYDAAEAAYDAACDARAARAARVAAYDAAYDARVSYEHELAKVQKEKQND